MRRRLAGLLYFYGVGVCVASNYDDHELFKFEASILSQYLEDFSSYTLKMFVNDYHTRIHNRLPAEERLRLSKLQGRFSLIMVKVLLVSLLDGFRDLTRAGVMSFDFNHLKCALPAERAALPHPKTPTRVTEVRRTCHAATC